MRCPNPDCKAKLYYNARFDSLVCYSCGFNITRYLAQQGHLQNIEELMHFRKKVDDRALNREKKAFRRKDED